MQTDRFERPRWVDSKLYPFDDKWMTIKGHQIHYVDEGPRDAAVLLFIHPGAGWSFTYRYHIEKLSKEFRCVAPDMPGYGVSKAAEGYKYTLLEQSHILKLFVQALDLQKIVVWANDGGGPTAILALASETDRVIGLVVGGTFGWSIKDYPFVTRMLRLLSSPMFRTVNKYTNFVAKSMGSKLALGARTLTKAELKHYTGPFENRETRNYTLDLYASFNDSETQKELDHALPVFRNKSVLIQFGKGDPMTDQNWHKRWAKEIPDHRLYILPHVKHFTFEGAPEITVQNFRTWWAELFASGRGKAIHNDTAQTARKLV
jgi:haloalkane dehalogenase